MYHSKQKDTRTLIHKENFLARIKTVCHLLLNISTTLKPSSTGMKKVCFPSATNTFPLLFWFTRCRNDLKKNISCHLHINFHFSIIVLLITIFSP